MTQMDYQSTMRALKGLMVETGSLACLGCGYEYSCLAHGCALLKNAVEHMEAALANYDHLIKLTKEQAEAIKEYELALSQPSNEPLTLEELREMDGEPVYSGKYKRWFLVIYFNALNKSQLMDRTGTPYITEDCAPLYRRPPEGGADA